MKLGRLLLTAFAAAAIATPAFARPVDHSDYVIYTMDDLNIVASPLEGSGGVSSSAPSTIYSSMSSFDAGWGVAPLTNSLVDDYVSTAPVGLHKLFTMRFGGGVDADGGVLFFDFFDTGNVLVGGFGVALPSGNFIWTISGFGDSVDIAEAGSMEMTQDTAGEFGPATSLTWFSNAGGADVGSNVYTFGAETGSSSSTAFSYELNIPAPGALALIGFAGLIGTRRRRRV